MSTHDVPGKNPENNDELAMGCWAEHDDGTLILVESTEDDRVIYSVFDLDRTPPFEYRDSMRIGAFKKTYTWDPKDKSSMKWTWHDKTAFPWDRIIQKGGRDGVKHVHADDMLNAAERIRRSRELHGSEVDEREIEAKVPKVRDLPTKILDALQGAIRELRK